MTAFTSNDLRGVLQPSGRVHDVCRDCGGFIVEGREHSCGRYRIVKDDKK